MCQGILTGCMHEAYLTGNCTLDGPCPFEMSKEDIEAWEMDYALNEQMDREGEP